MAATANQYTIDNLVQMNGFFTLADGVTPADPTTVVALVQDPTGLITQYTNATSPAVVRNGVGAYSVTMQLSLSGPWIYKFQGTGALTATTPDTYIEVIQSEVIPG
jgi:hypothetical protein